MFFGRKVKQIEKAGERRPMSVQKDFSANKQTHKHVLGSVGPQAQNSALQSCVVSLLGNATDSNLWLMNLSSYPGEQKRILTIMGASTFFVNYAQQDYPSRIDITVQELAGTLDNNLQSTHSIATLVPKGPAIAVLNPGGVVGYNIQYGLLGEARSFEISNIPQLTFNVTVGDDRTIASYPLLEAVVADLQVTRVLSMNEQCGGPRKMIKKQSYVTSTKMRTSLLGKHAIKAKPTSQNIPQWLLQAIYDDLIQSASKQQMQQVIQNYLPALTKSQRIELIYEICK